MNVLADDRIDVSLKLGIDKRSEKAVKDSLKKTKREIETSDSYKIKLSKQELDRERALQYEQKVRYALQKKEEKALAEQKKKADKIELANQKEKLAKEKLLNKAKEQNAVAIQKQEEAQRKLNSLKIKEGMLEDQKIKDLQVQLSLFKEQQARNIAGLESGSTAGFADADQVKAFGDSVKNLSIDTPDLGNKMKQLNSEFKNIQSGAKIASQETKSFGKSLLDAGKNFGIWIGLSTVIFQTISAIKNGVVVVKDLDSAMVELRKVTEETNQVYEEFLDNSFELAKATGKTATEAINAASAFARMGFDIEESARLAEQALILTNIGDGIESIDESTKALIATMKGFRDQGLEAKKVVDSLNEVSNNYALTTADLAEGIRRTSGTLSGTNTTFDETLGLLTGGIEVLQNVEKVSSGLVTISQRMRGISEDSEELVPQLDDVIASLETMSGEKVQIDIENSNGELRSTYEILEDIAAVYPDLTSKSEQYLGEALAGKRQIPVLKAILTNWESVQGAIESSTESAGSAEREQAVFLESIEGRMKTTGAQVQQFWNSVINSDLIKNLITAFGDFVQLLGDVENSVGIVNLLVGAFVALNAELLATKTLGMIDFFKNLTITMATFGGVMGVITLGVGALAVAAIAHEHAERKRIEALEETQKLLEEQINQSKQVEQLTEALINTTKGTEEYYEITRKLNSLLPDAKRAIDEQNDSLEKQYDIYNKVNEAANDAAVLEAQKVLADTSNIDELVAQQEKYNETIEEEEARVRDLTNEILLLREQGEFVSTVLTEGLDQAIERLEEAKEGYSDVSTEVDAYYAALQLVNTLQDNNFWENAGPDVYNFVGAVEESNDALKDNEDVVDSLVTTYATIMDEVSALTDNYELLSDAQRRQTKKFIQFQLSEAKARIESAKAQIEAENQLRQAIAKRGIVDIAFAGGDTPGYDPSRFLDVINEETLNVNQLTAELEKLYDIDDKILGIKKDTRTATEKLVDALEAELKVLQLREDLTDNEDEKNQLRQQQIDKLKELRNVVEEGSETWYQYSLQIKNVSDEISDSLNAAQEKANKLLEEQADIMNNEIKQALEDQIDNLDTLAEAKSAAFDTEIDALETQLDLLDEKNKAEEEELKRKELLYNLEKARDNLANTQAERNTRVYREGQGFVFEANPQAVASAQEAVKTATENLNKFETDVAKQNEREQLQNRINSLKAEQAEVAKSYQNQIATAQSAMSSITDVTNQELGKQAQAWHNWAANNREILNSFQNDIRNTIVAMSQLTMPALNVPAPTPVMNPTQTSSLSQSMASQATSAMNSMRGMFSTNVPKIAPVTTNSSSSNSVTINTLNVNGQQNARGFVDDLNRIARTRK